MKIRIRRLSNANSRIFLFQSTNLSYSTYRTYYRTSSWQSIYYLNIRLNFNITFVKNTGINSQTKPYITSWNGLVESHLTSQLTDLTKCLLWEGWLEWQNVLFGHCSWDNHVLIFSATMALIFVAHIFFPGSLWSLNVSNQHKKKNT